MKIFSQACTLGAVQTGDIVKHKHYLYMVITDI